MLGIFSAEKLKYALRVPLNGVSGSKKPFKGTLRAQMSEGGEWISQHMVAGGWRFGEGWP